MFELAGYWLDQDIKELKVEMEDMSHMLGVGPFERNFSDEKICKTKQVDFLGETWECILGFTNNKIYRIALSREYRNANYQKVKSYFLKSYGQPADARNNEEGMYNIWDTTLYQEKLSGPTSRSNLVLSYHRPFNVVNIIATGGPEFSKLGKGYLRPKASGYFTSFIVLIIVITILGYLLFR